MAAPRSLRCAPRAEPQLSSISIRTRVRISLNSRVRGGALNAREGRAPIVRAQKDAAELVEHEVVTPGFRGRRQRCRRAGAHGRGAGEHHLPWVLHCAVSRVRQCERALLEHGSHAAMHAHVLRRCLGQEQIPKSQGPSTVATGPSRGPQGPSLESRQGAPPTRRAARPWASHQGPTARDASTRDHSLYVM